MKAAAGLGGAGKERPSSGGCGGGPPGSPRAGPETSRTRPEPDLITLSGRPLSLVRQPCTSPSPPGRSRLPAGLGRHDGVPVFLIPALPDSGRAGSPFTVYRPAQFTGYGTASFTLYRPAPIPDTPARLSDSRLSGLSAARPRGLPAARAAFLPAGLPGRRDGWRPGASPRKPPQNENPAVWRGFRRHSPGGGPAGPFTGRRACGFRKSACARPSRPRSPGRPPRGFPWLRR